MVKTTILKNIHRSRLADFHSLLPFKTAFKLNINTNFQHSLNFTRTKLFGPSLLNDTQSWGPRHVHPLHATMWSCTAHGVLHCRIHQVCRARKRDEKEEQPLSLLWLLNCQQRSISCPCSSTQLNIFWNVDMKPCLESGSCELMSWVFA